MAPRRGDPVARDIAVDGPATSWPRGRSRDGKFLGRLTAPCWRAATWAGVPGLRSAAQLVVAKLVARSPVGEVPARPAGRPALALVNRSTARPSLVAVDKRQATDRLGRRGGGLAASRIVTGVGPAPEAPRRQEKGISPVPRPWPWTDRAFRPGLRWGSDPRDGGSVGRGRKTETHALLVDKTRPFASSRRVGRPQLLPAHDLDMNPCRWKAPTTPISAWLKRRGPILRAGLMVGIDIRPRRTEEKCEVSPAGPAMGRVHLYGHLQTATGEAGRGANASTTWDAGPGGRRQKCWTVSVCCGEVRAGGGPAGPDESGPIPAPRR